MPSYKLIYFNIKGRAELARLLFAQAGVKYEDVRHTQEKWAEIKPKTPFGQLPVLEVDGTQYCQTTAITAYLARQFGLAGDTNEEQMKVEMVFLCINELFEKFPFFEKDAAKKAEIEKELFTNVIPGQLKKLEAMLGKEYFVSKLSYADIAMMGSVHFLEKANPDVMKAAPKLCALAKKVEELPKIAAWLKDRPKTDF